MWWLLNQIQLAREQTVDELVLGSAGDRDSYLRALLEMASIRLEPDLAPAPLFLRRRHLRERVALIVSGGVMSKRRLRASLAFFSVLLPVAAGLGVQLVPLQGAPQADAAGIEVKSAVDILHRTGVEYPSSAIQAGLGGDVVVDVRVDSKGEVVGVTGVSGPEALRAALLRSVVNWHFDATRGLPEHFEVAARFTPVARATVGAAVSGVSPAFEGQPIRGVNLDQTPPALRDRIAAALPIRAGDTVNADRLREASQAVREIDEHLIVGTMVNSAGDRYVFVAAPGSRGTPTMAPPPPPPPSDVALPPDPNSTLR